MEVERVEAAPLGPVSVRLVARGHEVVQDKPAALGGSDQGMMASELLLASLLACQHSTAVKVAKKRRTDVEILGIAGELHFDAAGDIADIRVVFTLRSAAGDDALSTLLRLTDKSCTISRAVKVPVHATFSRAA